MKQSSEEEMFCPYANHFCNDLTCCDDCEVWLSLEEKPTLWEHLSILTGLQCGYLENSYKTPVPNYVRGIK